MSLSEDKRTLDFKVKPLVSIFLDDDRPDYKPGCSVLDVYFSEPVTVTEIRFRNSYTAFISVLCKRVAAEKDVKNRDMLPWQASVRKFILMQDPEYEKNSQDIFSIPMSESCIPWIGVVNIRFILKQPSFRWKRFNLEELTFYGETTKDCKQCSASHLSSTVKRPESKASVTDIDKYEPPMSPKSRYMWSISELIRDKQATGSAVGRFEVIIETNPVICVILFLNVVWILR